MRQEVTNEFMAGAPKRERRRPVKTLRASGAKKPSVEVRIEELVFPTWMPAAPDKNPMFLEKRVYQGSSGKVYPLPFTDRIAEKPVDRKWKAVWIENEFLRVLVLPEIGGRIHSIQDKTNGYDLIYNQPVIKPALVGLAGPWISGGIEFNWPQHHRPATFLPVNFEVEEYADGSKTIWCCDHDPMCRMKGMHGVCLHPDRAVLELKVRAYNRTPFTQTFLWWANVATRVHEMYQSFFPPDVHGVADHARRSMSEYPLAKGFYYGVNYGARARTGTPVNEVPLHFVPPHIAGAKLETRNGDSTKGNAPHYRPDDLSFYANIPTPCSYMCIGSREDFFGGYDYKAQAGLVHIADHHIAPGKKQWTWGNHNFGYAWDRNLTEPDAQGEFRPYIELMAGVYTDNQPDFSFLQPGETKSWSQYWYPIQKIGPAQHANLNAAVSLNISSSSTGNGHRAAVLGIVVTRAQPQAKITFSAAGKSLFSRTCDLAPGKPLVERIDLPHGVVEADLSVRVTDDAGCELIAYQPKLPAKANVPAPATEPPAPRDIASTDELFITGVHLQQYRHATRCPTPYWREALRRDPEDSRANNALGLWHLRRGEFDLAEKHFHRAIDRLSHRNANPADGEAHYNLGLCLRYQLDRVSPNTQTASKLFDDAYAAFYKATWNQAWVAAGYHALAELDCRRHDWAKALEHLDYSLRFNTENTRARNLKALVLQKLDREADATALLDSTVALDPLDWWARHLRGKSLAYDLQAHLDIAHDYARAGFYDEAVELLRAAKSSFRDQSIPVRKNDGHIAKLPDQSWGAEPLVEYTLGWLCEQRGEVADALKYFKAAAAMSPDYCFPSRLEEITILESAMRANPKDARAPYYLGNLFYDRRRHDDAIRMWERSTKQDTTYSVAWRNLGIGYFNIRRQPAKARAAYNSAVRANPQDARLVFERDQLWKRLGEKPIKRLHELEKYPQLVRQRDDLSVELCALYNQTGQHAKALDLISSRKFQPWEGGEGQALGQHVRTHVALGRCALQDGDVTQALAYFEQALTSPENLSEAKHLLANQSDIHYWLGRVWMKLRNKTKAYEHWRAAATFTGDFQEMSVRAFSEMTYYSALSWECLGKKAKARKFLRELLAYAQRLQKTPAKIDYFATSLPTMLLFEDDIQFRQETTALFLQAQAQLGLRKRTKAISLLKTVLKRDPNHALATDLLEGNI